MRILILFFVLGSLCHAEIRTWTAVNGKEVEAEFVSNEKGIVKLKLKSGKVFEVPANKLSKEDNEFISSLAKPEGVNRDELERRKDIVYLKGSDTPYTGKATSRYGKGKLNSRKKRKGNYKNGKKDGLFVGWRYGTKLYEENYKDGKKDGLFVRWNYNGQKKSEENYKDGKMDGLFTRWYENGQKQMETNYKNGRKVGLWNYWYPNGQKKLTNNNP